MFKKLKTTTLALATAAAMLIGSGQSWALDRQPRPGFQQFLFFGGQLGDGSISEQTSQDGIDNCSLRISVLDFGDDSVNGFPRRAWAVYLGPSSGVAQSPNRLAFTINNFSWPDGRWVNSGGSVVTLDRINECLAARGLSGTASNLQQFSGPNGSGDIAGVSFYGFSFDYLGQTYRYGWSGASNSVPVNDLIPLPDEFHPQVELERLPETPDVLTGTDRFTVKATFSEDVSGFEDVPTDVEVTNGSLVAISAGNLLPDGREEYILTIEPTGNGDVTIVVPEGTDANPIAEDAAGNHNDASRPLVIRNRIVEITQEAIAGFMLGRANNLASIQPGLTRFLQGDGCEAFSANANEASGSINGCVSNGNTWAEITSSWSGDGSYTLGTIGAHTFVNPNFLFGGMVQFDYADDPDNNASGRGWMVGPYFVARVPEQPLYFEGRLLYGETDNDISPLGTYTDSFETERWLAQLRATGEYQVQNTTLMPLLDFTYTEDSQQTYTDSLGNTIPGQTVSLMQLSTGMDFSTPLPVQTGSLDLTGGLSGIYASTDGGAAAPEFENWRARTHLGLNYDTGAGATMNVGAFYDGLGTDFESYGANLNVDWRF